MFLKFTAYRIEGILVLDIFDFLKIKRYYFMQKFYKRESKVSRLVPVLFLLLIMFCSACSKKTEEPVKVIEKEMDVYAYEVTCTACEIQFTDKNKSTKKVSNNNGKWSYSFEKTNDADLKIMVKTTNNLYQNISAYILKNDDVIYGDLGYNSFELTYNIKSGHKTMTYGSYYAGPIVPVPSSPGSTGGNTKPTSSVCGAKTKGGGYCKRMVSGGGRCWQH